MQTSKNATVAHFFSFFYYLSISGYHMIVVITFFYIILLPKSSRLLAVCISSPIALNPVQFRILRKFLGQVAHGSPMLCTILRLFIEGVFVEALHWTWLKKKCPVRIIFKRVRPWSNTCQCSKLHQNILCCILYYILNSRKHDRQEDRQV